MPEEINYARRSLLGTFFASSATTITAAELGTIGTKESNHAL